MRTTTDFVGPDQIRVLFSSAMSEMYRQEVPLYGDLQDLVEDINADTLAAAPALRESLVRSGEFERMGLERHGAIRVGTPAELATLRRIFAVMGMWPVGYYDLSVAGVPVHSTAFRPIDDEALAINPFRVFTSLLRLDLLSDAALGQQAHEILAKRQIFTPRALELLSRCEQLGGLTTIEAHEFVREVQETFRWHGQATVDERTYHALHQAHRLIADVVCFPGPHINHLTPRTLDIDALQAQMPGRGMPAKEVVEGPPRRVHAILLRQTSFKALEETVHFAGAAASGTHTARFGEVEQRGMALTRAGRALYDELLSRARRSDVEGGDYSTRLARAFEDFPDDLHTLHQRDLAFFRYRLTPEAPRAGDAVSAADLNPSQWLERGWVQAEPITYEDFLPVSAAGIFQSNLGGSAAHSFTPQQDRPGFERDLGAVVQDEIALYEAARQRSIDAVRAQLRAAPHNVQVA